MAPLLALLAAAAPPAMIVFPGPVTSIRSPTSAARVYYVERGADEGGQNLALRFDAGNGRAVAVKRIDRWVQVAWAPGGDRFFVNDYWGSNVADCLVVRPIASGVRGISLMRRARRTRGGPHGLERPYDAHYYLTCEAWRPNGTIAGIVGGHTDEAGGGHAFRYRFTYDLGSGRLRWIHEPQQPPLPVLPE